MANIDISVIIPLKDNKEQVASLIKRLCKETDGIETEFVVVDMNSTDGGVLNTLNVIKSLNLRGCVVQSGGVSVSSALNTGIRRATGKYLTFVYPSRSYRDYISQYYRTAQEKNADFIFAVPENEDGSRVLISDGVVGTDIIVSLIRSSIIMEFTAVMFSRDFLVSQNICFYDDCLYGYAEAFIYNALLHRPKVTYLPLKLERIEIPPEEKDEPKAAKNCLDRLDAMIKIYRLAKELHKNDEVLINAIEYQKLPSIIMNCVDKLLLEGFKNSSIKKLLKSKDYYKFLDFSKDTDPGLRAKVLLWKSVPWLYKP